MLNEKKALRLGLLIFYIVLSAAGLVLIKMGRTDTTIAIKDNLFTASVNLKLLLGLMAYICSFLLFVFLTGKFDLSYLFPVASSTIIVLTAVIGAVVLGEKLTAYSIAGIALISIGVIVINLKR